MQITFDKSAKNFILESFNKSINTDGVIVEKDNPTQKVLTQDGQEIMEYELGGVIPGSTIFVKNDLPTVMKLSDNLKSPDGNPK